MHSQTVERKDNFFISYSRPDRTWAEWIAWQLEAAGFTTILQAWDFRAGSNWALNMKKATAESERTIAVLSPDYLKSENAQAEWAAAFAKDPAGLKRKIIPIRVRPVDLTGLDSAIIYIDLVGKDEQSAKEALATELQEGRLRPPSAPPFPATGDGTVGTVSPQTPQPLFPAQENAADDHTILTALNRPAFEMRFDTPPVLIGEVPAIITVHFKLARAPAHLLLSFDQESFGIDSGIVKDVDISETADDKRFVLTFSRPGNYDIPFSIRALEVKNVNGRIRVVLKSENGTVIKSEKRWININARQSWVDALAGTITWVTRHKLFGILGILTISVILLAPKLHARFPRQSTMFLSYLGLIEPDLLVLEEDWSERFELGRLKHWEMQSGAEVIPPTADALIRLRKTFDSLTLGLTSPQNKGSQHGALEISKGGFARPVLWDPSSHPRRAKEPILRKFQTRFTGFFSSGSSAEWMLCSRPNDSSGSHWHGYHLTLESSISPQEPGHQAQLRLTGEVCADLQAQHCTERRTRELPVIASSWPLGSRTIVSGPKCLTWAVLMCCKNLSRQENCFGWSAWLGETGRTSASWPPQTARE